MALLPPLRQARLRARLRARAFLATVAILVATACGGTDLGTSTGTTVPTAAPYPSVPSATVVTGSPTASATGTAAPGGAAGEQTYTVVAGDVLTSIAAKFDVPSAQIRTLNNLTSDALSIGQKLRIPAKSATPAPTPTPAGSASTYVVKQGDTALGIALQYDTTVEALERANGVAAGGLTNLQLGQVVKLPPPGQR